jgi:NAD(P)-dependent dehydrogenase (short-subunit alcohol dehydrogenase family)
MMKGNSGRVAVVTGGGGGIGRGICLRLAGEEGVSVVVADQHLDKAQETVSEVEAQQGAARAFAVDVTNPDGVKSLFNHTESEFGTASILVNCVAVSEGLGTFETSPEQWHRTLSVNVGSYFLCAQELATRLKAAGMPGSVVNISSTNAFYAELDSIAYTASKGAVGALTKGLALELAASNIRVNAICPGLIRTPVTEWMMEHSGDPDALLKTWSGAHMLGRIGEPSEMAAVVAFLASDEASFVTGSSWVADGGLSSGWTF